MDYTKLQASHIEKLAAMVPKDRFSTGESNLDLHAKDMSSMPPGCPEAVMWPVDRTEVANILTYADRHRIPVIGWGAGSSLSGNPIPVSGGIVMDFSRMDRIIEVRPEDFQVDVEPGIGYKDLNKKLSRHGLFFPPDPGAGASIGGMIANNASGTRTVRYGATKDNVLKLTVVLANGEIIETGTRAAKTSSGYDLLHLFVGSEGTLGLVVEATLKLSGIPEEMSAAVVTFPSVSCAGKAVFEIMRWGFDPAALELLSPECIALINKEKDLGLKISPTLFMEFHGPTENQLSVVLELVREICAQERCTNFLPGLGREERNRLFAARHELGEMIMRNHPGKKVISLDMAVPVSAYAEMISFARSETDRAGVPTYIFSHAGDGNLHVVVAGNKEDRDEWTRIENVNERLVFKALDMEGTCTGEHGIGMEKRKYMSAEHGNSLLWMKKVKDLFDPNGILNPGKIFPDDV